MRGARPVVALMTILVVAVTVACGRDTSDPHGTGSGTTVGAAAWQRSRVEAAGTTVSVACRGQGGPTVWFVTSLGEDGTQGWLESGVPDLVAERTRACVYDRPGLGESGPATGERTVERHTVELDELLTAMGETAPVVAVGQGYGTFVARLFAKEHLDRLAGLVLVDPTLWTLPTEAPDGSSEGVRAEYAQVSQINKDLGGYGGAALPPPPAPTFIIGVAADLPARPVGAADPAGTGTQRTAEPDPPQAKRHEMQQGLANKSPFGKFIVLADAGSAAQHWDPSAVAKVIFDVLAHPNLRR